MVKKIATLSAKNKKVAAARRAAGDLGGFKTALQTLGRFAKTRGSGATSAEKAALKTFVIKGGALVAEILGVSACFEITKKVL